MAPPPVRRCKECGPDGKRPAPHPGPRCATHQREWKRELSRRAHAKRLAQVYSITAEVYAALYRIQGGRCAICQRATGERKRLAVDHDHACCDGPVSCGRCVRGLLCKSCNQTLGRFRDDPAAFRRAADYLEHWPSRDLPALSGVPRRRPVPGGQELDPVRLVLGDGGGAPR